MLQVKCKQAIYS